jgi:DNA polymerase delta subunit 1
MDTPARKFLEDSKGTINLNLRRPAPKPLNPLTDALTFMQIDADYTSESWSTSEEPVIRLFGITEEGNSVLALVYNFEPYFYVPVPSHFPYGPSEREGLIQALNVRREGRL